GAGGTSDLGEVVRLTLRLSRRFRRALDEPLLSELGLNVKELLVLAAVIRARFPRPRAAALSATRRR
ncbi:hypothetical protein CTI14_44125, partial [Methylobacterium radiotolerans]